MKFINRGLTYQILYSDEDSKKISEKYKLNVNGSGFLEIDKRDQEIIKFNFDNTSTIESKDHYKMCEIFSRLYYKVHKV